MGLENVVAQARAEVRAMAFRRLQGADLNGDGAISGPEVQVTAAAASAVSRGRMIVHFGHADADGDGAVSVTAIFEKMNIKPVGLPRKIVFSQPNELQICTLNLQVDGESTGGRP